MPWPQLSIFRQIWIRSFKWGTVPPCRSRDCKNIRGQSWKLKKICQISQARSISLKSGWVSNFLLTSNYKSAQYLIWKIWFISVWRLKARAMAWLLMWFMFAQSTLISYHSQAFVKTEVGCTVVSLRNSRDYSRLKPANWPNMIDASVIEVISTLADLQEPFNF